METRIREIKARNFPEITIKITPGHFATRHSHINYYVDLTSVKCYQKIARQAANALASQYSMQTPVDTIVCLDGAEVIAAFLSAALTQKDSRSINAGADIAIVTPETNAAGQLIFRDNTQHMIWNKNVLLLVASATTGKTINQAIDCIHYYSGRVSGICALFSAINLVNDIPVVAIFTTEDVPGYETFKAGECPECKLGHKIDALVNNYGYSKL